MASAFFAKATFFDAVLRKKMRFGAYKSLCEAAFLLSFLDKWINIIHNGHSYEKERESNG